MGEKQAAVMTVTGYDATHNLVPNIPWNAAVVLGYVTGTSTVRWRTTDWKKFPHARKVFIDQGGPGSPVLWAHVRDVESGAWTPENAVQHSQGWDVERPTIYCNQSTLPRVISAGWKGDVWLAKLQSSRPEHPPVISGVNVVCQQYAFRSVYDLNAVFDDTWPHSGKEVSSTAFQAPTGLHETATVELAWAHVPEVDGVQPSGYTVAFYGLDGRVYWEKSTSQNKITASGLHKNWTYEVHVWANGGKDAPPHASLRVTT